MAEKTPFSALLERLEGRTAEDEMKLLVIEVELLTDAVQWLYAAAELHVNPLPLLQAHQVSRRSNSRSDFALRASNEVLKRFRDGIAKRVKLLQIERGKK